MKNISFHLNRKLWVTMALLLTLALPGFAQKITVHGYVDDELGEPLIPMPPSWSAISATTPSRLQ